MLLGLLLFFVLFIQNRYIIFSLFGFRWGCFSFLGGLLFLGKDGVVFFPKFEITVISSVTSNQLNLMDSIT